MIEKIKKAEIHVHLEATIMPKLCRKFAKNKQYGSDYDSCKYRFSKTNR